MTYELQNHFRAVERIYWNVSPIALVGVLDQIRNRVVALVAELRAVTPDRASPSGKAVTNAVQVAIYGRARDIHVTAPQASGAASTAMVSAPGGDKPWWRKAKVLWTIAVGVATIVGTIITWLQFK